MTSAPSAKYRRRAPRWRVLARPRALTLAAYAIAGLIAVPVVFVASSVFLSSGDVWGHLLDTVLWTYVENSLWLIIMVGCGVTVIGASAAWLVTMCDFPGRRVFEWALLLPLAVPAYVMAYVYTDLLSYPGPAQSALRAAFGWSSARDYWFPSIRSLPGAAIMLTLALYPYPYLMARAAFINQSVCVLEASRTLGAGPWGAFLRVGLPLARPAIAGGAALSLMETLNEFGAMQYFGVATFSTGIFRTWFGLGSRIGAAQLASVLLLFIVALIAVERWSRGDARYFQTSLRYRVIRRLRLGGRAAAGAWIACASTLLLGFVVPAGNLLYLAVAKQATRVDGRFFGFVANSLILAAAAAALAVAIAALLAYARRLHPTPALRLATQAAAMGYAVPGAVVAVGVLTPFGAFDNALDAFMRETFGLTTGLLLTGTIAAVVFAYLVRFMAVALNAVEANLNKVTPSLDGAARTLGAGPSATLWRVHMPLMRGGVLAAAILVFVDVMKELPATMIIRPFNFDTLAVQTYRLASDERLEQAALYALSIVLVGMLPVLLLDRSLARSRPGQGAPTP